VHLERLTLLKDLDLSETNITSAGLRHVRELHRLKSVNVSGCPRISPYTAKRFQKMTGKK